MLLGKDDEIVNFKYNCEKSVYTNPEFIPNKLKDTRNNIITNGIIAGIDSYLNYLDLLMIHRDKWVSTGYLDLGMIPIIYGPSFLHHGITLSLLPILKRKGVKLYNMPYSSFLTSSSYNSSIKDYWAFREDLVDIVGEDDIYKITTRKVIEKVLRW